MANLAHSSHYGNGNTRNISRCSNLKTTSNQETSLQLWLSWFRNVEDGSKIYASNISMHFSTWLGNNVTCQENTPYLGTSLDFHPLPTFKKLGIHPWSAYHLKKWSYSCQGFVKAIKSFLHSQEATDKVLLAEIISCCSAIQIPTNLLTAGKPHHLKLQDKIAVPMLVGAATWLWNRYLPSLQQPCFCSHA